MKNYMNKGREKVKEKFENLKERLKELTERLKALKAFPSKYSRWLENTSIHKKRQLRILAAYFLLITAVLAGVYMGQDRAAERIQPEPMDQSMEGNGSSRDAQDQDTPAKDDPDRTEVVIYPPEQTRGEGEQGENQEGQAEDFADSRHRDDPHQAGSPHDTRDAPQGPQDEQDVQDPQDVKVKDPQDVQSGQGQQGQQQGQQEQAGVSQDGVSPAFIWPVRGEIIVEFHEIYNVENQYQLHSGINIKAKEGDPVSASLSGIVQEVKDKSTMGKKIIISHPHEINTIYANLSTVKVSPGEEVGKGHIIGMAGDTAQRGASEGFYLYFGVKDHQGLHRDPLKYLP